MIIIDQRTDHPSYGLAARKIWKELFRLTKAWEWRDLDSFLCDLQYFEDKIRKDIRGGSGRSIFYWHWHESGLTTILDFNDTTIKNSFKITVNRPFERRGWNIVIERLFSQGEKCITS